MSPTGDREFRELLIRVDQNLINLINTVEAHIVADNVRFDKQDREIEQIKRIVFMGVGGVIVIQVCFQVFLK